MDFDNAKENIQPLATGRNASILQMSISQSSRELLDQRREYENSIHSYNGDDPLEAWYNYIGWIEQSFPSGGKESGLMEVISKCLRRFESEERYYQDRRMIKLFIKFLESRKDSAECYQQLYNAGIGTMVADFYIAWAYCYDSMGQMRRADEVFRRGIECRAQPLDELKEAHQHFGFAVAQRTLYRDDEDALVDTNRQIEERRSALSSLRGYQGRHHRGEVGSIRTGVAIKSLKPGKIQSDGTYGSTSSSNTRIAVLTDENENPNASSIGFKDSRSEQSSEFESMTVVRSIIDKTRHQENQKEPGPWNKVHDKKNAKKLMRQKKTVHELGFNIHEDKDDDENSLTENPNAFFQNVLNESEQNYEKPFRYPENFVNKNRPQPEWILPVTTECEANPNALPRYNKSMVYPRPNREFQHEELCGYMYFKKRGIQNAFTQRYDAVWSNDISVPIRLYPNFARQSKPQVLGEVDQFFAPPLEDGEHMVPLKQLYDIEKQEEFQSEELLAARLRNAANATVTSIEDMEETMCASSSNDQVQRRKSFFPMRRSLAIRSITAKIENPKESIENGEPETPLGEPEIAHNSTVSKDSSNLRLKEDPSSQKKHQTVLSKENEDGNTTHAMRETMLPSINRSQHVDFNFKTPALPTKPIKQSPEILEPSSQNHGQPSSKLPFEIYVEENTPSTSNTPGATGIFDAEETCSTQVFNNFIKTQSASTPKVSQKVQKRQFGVLLEAPMPTVAPGSLSSLNIENTNDNNINEVSPTPTTNSPSSPDLPTDTPSNSFSPLPRKQLSTILETSEHGTTQGTHSTAASTKSTVGSQESDFGDTAPRTTAIPKETANCQSTSEVVEMMREVHLKDPEKTSPNSPHKQQNEPGTNFKYSSTTGDKFSIYVDDTETFPKLPKIPLDREADAGNFERLFEREDTATGYFGVQGSLRFQEDKTETITKIAYPRVFTDDRTETIPQMHESIFSLGQQQTPNPVKRLLPKNSSTFLETPHMKETKKNSPKDVISNINLPTEESKISQPDDDDDDCLQFFRMSPRDIPKVRSKVGMEINLTPVNDANVKRQSANQRSDTLPLNKFSCEKNNSKEELLKFFESEMMDVDEDVNGIKIAEKSMSMISKNEKRLLHTIPNEREKQNESEMFASASAHGNKLSAVSENVSLNKNEKENVFGNDFSMMEKKSSIFMQTSANDGNNFDYLIPPQNNSKIPSLLPDNSFQINTQSLGIHHKFPPPSQCDASLPEISLIEETQQPNTNTSMSNISKTNAVLPKKLFGFQSHDSFKVELSHIEQSKIANESKQIREKLNFPSHIPKPFPKKNSLIEPNTTASKLRYTEAQKSSSFLNISKETSFIPETQELSSKSSNPNNANLTRSNNSLQRLNLLSSKGNGCTETSAQRDFSKDTMISKETNYQPVKNSILSKNDDPKTNQAQHQLEYDNQIFELNAETEMFSTGLSTISNSTMLPPCSNPHLQSIHSKEEQCSEHDSKTEIRTQNNTPLNSEGDMSIYFQNTPRTSLLKIHAKSWSGSDEELVAHDNVYLHHDIDLNETAQRIQNMCEIQQVNPFNAELLNAFLDQIDFVNYLNNLNNTMLVGKVRRLTLNSIINVNDKEFKILKLIGEGAYGIIYSGVEVKSGKMYAFKQERPPNYWEYYICLEVKSRITNEEILPAYMDIDYALIGNNASIFISPFSSYGSIIAVCNKAKKQTLKNLDEYVVMHLACELLEIIDHLHAACIIHADVKADNFLLMKKLTYNSRQVSLQLIDFGVSIDMKQFKKTQTFTYIQNDNAFKCVEMRENRPWTYQLDLYGLAGVLHVMLFGKYMDVEKRNDKGIWMPKTHMPRYINKLLWERIFRTLLNVRDCSSMPNLQQLRSLIKEEMAEKERYVVNKIAEFNKALDV